MKRPIAFSLGILVVFVALGAIGYFVLFKGTILGPTLTASEFERLDELRRSANRDLENQAQLDVGSVGSWSPDQVASEQVKTLTQMASPYAELAKELPGEVIGPRNEAVLWMLAQMPNGIDRQGLSEADVKLLDDRATAAIQTILQRQDTAASSHMLAALFALRRMERLRANREMVQSLRDEAIAELKKAQAADPKSIEAAYQLGVLLDDVREAAPPKEAVEAFAKAFEARPSNFYVLMRRLNTLVRTKSAETAKACRDAKAQCECVRRRILRENDPESDLILLLDRAATAADAMKWEEAADALQIFDSWLTAIAADLGDLPEVTPHPLDYMAFDFSPKLRGSFPPSQITTKPIAVSFQVSPPSEHRLMTDARDTRLVEYDLDGKLELAALEEKTLSLFEGDEDGNWTHATTIETGGGAQGMCWGDLDRDEDPQIQGDYKADLDVVIFGEKGLRVFRNNAEPNSAKRSFELLATLLVKPVTAAVLVDFDHDGDLDIVAAIEEGFSLFINLGNAQFDDVSKFSSIAAGPTIPLAKLVAVDFDRDGDLDVITTCLGRERAGYLDNTRHGQMRWRDLPAGFEDLTKATHLFVVDFDGNASWDLVLQCGSDAVLLLTEQTGDGEIRLNERKVIPLGKPELKRQLEAVADFDNDTHLDLLIIGEEGGMVLRSNAANQFLEADSLPLALPSGFDSKIAADVDDIDQDGDLDAVFVTGGICTAMNNGGNLNNWVTVRPRGAEDNVSGKVNHFGLGTLVEIQAGASYQAAVSDRPSVHFGLGAVKSADQIRLVFTNGFPQSVLKSRLTGNQFIVEEMALKGSCPYVYADRGNGWEFFSDCLWGAPIGMQYAEAKLQPGRPWEYLKLPGELLQEKEGAYRIKFTEELWEATYVDHVSLIAIDHPEGVEIFTNEKVGPPSVAENRLFTVTERKLPVVAKDLKGRDLSKTLAKADGDFSQCWDRSYKQGLVERHGLELDLGAFEPNATVVLYLTGWIMPTDTSLNVALTQHPDLEGPKPPSLSVFNEQGTPIEIMPMLGFPGGKTKTIAIDLAGKFLSNDHRVVISTTHQIYWDEAFFTLNEPTVEVESQVLPLLTARMSYHGFCKKQPAQPRSPSVFSAAEIDPSPRWLPMRGGFTPFGDALSLLTESDDRMAIIGAGDGLELTFQAMPPPKLGWKRDFILHSVGWDKDADLNTFFGQTVGPMPVGGDGGYLGPAVIGKSGEEGTRIQPRARFWKQLSNSK